MRGFGEHPQRCRLQTRPVVAPFELMLVKTVLRVFVAVARAVDLQKDTSHACAREYLTWPHRRLSPASNNRCARRGASSGGARRFRATGSRASRASTASRTLYRAWCTAQGIGVDSADAVHRACITTPAFAEDHSVRTTKRCGGGSGTEFGNAVGCPERRARVK